MSKIDCPVQRVDDPPYSRSPSAVSPFFGKDSVVWKLSGNRSSDEPFGLEIDIGDRVDASFVLNSEPTMEALFEDFTRVNGKIARERDQF